MPRNTTPLNEASMWLARLTEMGLLRASFTVTITKDT
jgi:hypothetical protein